jgi:hypothetical protein
MLVVVAAVIRRRRSRKVRALSVVEPGDCRYGGEQPSGEVSSHPVAGGRQLEPGHPPVAGVSCPLYQLERLQPVTDGGHVASLAAQVAGEVTHRLRFVEVAQGERLGRSETELGSHVFEMRLQRVDQSKEGGHDLAGVGIDRGGTVDPARDLP